MDIGMSVTGFLLFHSRDRSGPHKIAEGKASSPAFMGDVSQQNLAKSNGLDDRKFVFLVFHKPVPSNYLSHPDSVSARCDSFGPVKKSSRV
jgi:hypothetical protein